MLPSLKQGSKDMAYFSSHSRHWSGQSGHGGQKGQHRPANQNRVCWRLLVMSVVLLSLVSACASSPGGNSQRATIGSSPIQACRATDTAISSSAQCLSGDAACYQLANGSWCTGTRDNVCPSGSSVLTTGTACPKGARCFAVSQNLTCAIL